MKKILLTIMSLLLVSSLAMAVEPEEGPTEQETPAVTLSKSDSFLVAFGMKDSQDEEENQMSAATVAHASAHASAISLTHLQNTPYSYK